MLTDLLLPSLQCINIFSLVVLINLNTFSHIGINFSLSIDQSSSSIFTNCIVLSYGLTLSSYSDNLITNLILLSSIKFNLCALDKLDKYIIYNFI